MPVGDPPNALNRVTLAFFARGLAAMESMQSRSPPVRRVAGRSLNDLWLDGFGGLGFSWTLSELRFAGGLEGCGPGKIEFVSICVHSRFSSKGTLVVAPWLDRRAHFPPKTVLDRLKTTA
jgi:hypothetical protein